MRTQFITTLKIRGRGLAKNFASHLLSRGYASNVADRGDLTKPSQAVRPNTPGRSVSNRYLARRSRARVVLEPLASSQISKNSNNRQNRSIFENVDIRAEDTDVLGSNRVQTGFKQGSNRVHCAGRPYLVLVDGRVDGLNGVTRPATLGAAAQMEFESKV